jgi:cytochrome c peroxidase
MKRGFIFSLILVSLFGVSCVSADDASKWLRPVLIPAPADNKITPQRVALGKLLYFDTRLSRDDSISCASCHSPDKAWADKESKALGIEGRRGSRNSPTILNTAYQNRQFWDGRVKTLEDQALGPIQASVEMDMNLTALILKLNAIKGYVELFEKAYLGDGITKETLAKAIASFERTIVSSESDFDRFIKGDEDAISKEAKRGFELFKSKARCVLCHDKFNFSDGSFHNIGLGDSDIGRYALKKRSAWYHAFKTPTLRNISKTSPYFHDGSVKTLEEACYICANGGRFKYDTKKSLYIIDNKLNKNEIKDLVSFLETLDSKSSDIDIPTKFPQ